MELMIEEEMDSNNNYITLKQSHQPFMDQVAANKIEMKKKDYDVIQAKSYAQQQNEPILCIPRKSTVKK